MIIAKKLSRVILEKSEENVTGKGGLVWTYHCAESLGLKKLVNRKFQARKSNRQVPAWEKLMTGALMVISGGERIEDINVLRSDPTLINGLGWNRMISPDTFLNFLKYKITGTKIQQINEWLSIRAMAMSPLNEFTYDNDASYFDCNKKCATYSYQKEKQMSGLLGNIPELSGICVTAELRPGNISPADGILEQLKQSCKLAKKAGKRISRFRSDSAAHKYEIFKYCDTEDIKFFVTLDKNSVTKSEVAGIRERDWHSLPDRDDVEWSEFTHCIALNKKNKVAMRALVLRWPNPDMTLFEQSLYCYHVIATNDMDISPMDWLHFHNQRMGSENYHKELKSGFAGKYMPSNKFQKNRTFFMINVFAYNLVQMMKMYFFENHEQNWTIKTIRYRFINTCIRFVKGQRYLRCRIINVTDETFKLFKDSWNKLHWI